MRTIWARAALAAIIAIFFACSNGSETREPLISIGDTTGEASDAGPYWDNETPLSMADLELGRHDSTWLEIASADTSRVQLAPRDLDRVARSSSDSGLPTVQLPVSGDAEGPIGPLRPGAPRPLQLLARDPRREMGEEHP